MVRGKKMDRRGSGPAWFLMLAIVLFIIYSMAVAVYTEDDCPGGKDWQFLPPKWECTGGLPGS